MIRRASLTSDHIVAGDAFGVAGPERGQLDVVDVVRPDPVAGRDQATDLLPGEVAELDRVERQVELGDHPARLEHRQDGLDPVVRSVVEGDDHRSCRERRPLVPVGGEIARQDRRVAVEEEPVELGGEGLRQDVVGDEPPLRGRSTSPCRPAGSAWTRW